MNVNTLLWLSNTKLLVGLQAFHTGNPTVHNGIYIFDISAMATPAGVDEVTCSAFSPSPKQTAFVQFSYKPLGAAFRP